MIVHVLKGTTDKSRRLYVNEHIKTCAHNDPLSGLCAYKKKSFSLLTENSHFLEKLIISAKAFLKKKVHRFS